MNVTNVLFENSLCASAASNFSPKSQPTNPARARMYMLALHPIRDPSIHLSPPNCPLPISFLQSSLSLSLSLSSSCVTVAISADPLKRKRPSLPPSLSPSKAACTYDVFPEMGVPKRQISIKYLYVCDLCVCENDKSGERV